MLDIYLSVPALDTTVENTDEANNSDQEKPPPKDEEHLVKQSENVDYSSIHHEVSVDKNSSRNY